MRFKYVAYSSRTGLVKGHMDARQESEVRAEIEKQGLKLLKVSTSRKIPAAEILFPSLFKVGSAELVRVARQLATMLASGSNLLRALEMLERESTNRLMRAILSDIRKTLDEGGSLSEAMASHSKVFSKLFISVVEVGEYTGKLSMALEQLADILEKEQEAKSKAIRTLMYPAAIMGLSFVTLGVLVTVALPPLLAVFEDMDTEVPIMTKVVVGLVGGISKNFLWIGLGFVAFLAMFITLRRVPHTRFFMDKMFMRSPVLGPFLLAGELSRFSRTISLLLESGVTLANAMHLAINGCKNHELRQAFIDAEDSLITGHRLTDALRKFTIIPTMFMELVSLGEEANSLQRTMKDAAEAYQKQLERRLDSILGMLEPASTLVVGGIVGVIAFSMFVPIYSGLNAVK